MRKILVGEQGGAEEDEGRALLCRGKCAGEWAEEKEKFDGFVAPPGIGDTAKGLRPFSEMPISMPPLSSAESANFSVLELGISLGGGLGRGHYRNMKRACLLKKIWQAASAPRS